MSRALPWDWQIGVTDKTLSDGRILNPAWYPYSTEQMFFSGDMVEGFSYSETDNPILNFFEYETFILPDGYDLSIKEIDVTGNDSYTLPFKAADIYAVGRLIKTDIVTVTNSYTVTIPTPESVAIGVYDSRFTSNNTYLPKNQGKFLGLFIDPDDGTRYFRVFTISGATLTLKDIATGANSGITGIAANWSFWLVGHYNILPESTQIPAAVVDGYVIKNVALGTGEASIKFSQYDYPLNKNEKLAIIYYAVDNAKPQYSDPESILQHGIYVKSEKPDFIMESSQLNTLQVNSQKYYKSQKKFTLKTKRPSKLIEGDNVYINVTPYPSGIYEVSSVKTVVEHETGEISEDALFEVTEYEFTNYDYDLDTVLLQLKNKNQVTQARVTQALTRNYPIKLNLIAKYFRNITRIGGVQNLEILSTTSTSVSIGWDALTGAEEYRIYVSEYSNFSVIKKYISGISNFSDRVAYYQTSYSKSGLEANTDLYIKVTAIIAGIETDFSNTVNYYNTNPLNNGTIALNFNEGTGTTVADDSVNSNTGSFFGTPTWTTGNVKANAVEIGTNDAIRVTDNSSYHDEKIITMTVTFKNTLGNSVNRFIAEKYGISTATAEFDVYIRNDNYLDLRVYRNEEAIVCRFDSVSALSISLDDWVALTFCFNVTAGTCQAVLNQTELPLTNHYEGGANGYILIGSMTNISNSTYDMFVGNNQYNNGVSGGNAPLGIIEYFGITNQAKTVAEMQAIHAGLGY